MVKEIEQRDDGAAITNIVKAQRAKWLGHKTRTEIWVKRVLKKRSSRKSWLQVVRIDLREVSIYDWQKEV